MLEKTQDSVDFWVPNQLELWFLSTIQMKTLVLALISHSHEAQREEAWPHAAFLALNVDSGHGTQGQDQLLGAWVHGFYRQPL